MPGPRRHPARRPRYIYIYIYAYQCCPSPPRLLVFKSGRPAHRLNTARCEHCTAVVKDSLLVVVWARWIILSVGRGRKAIVPQASRGPRRGQSAILTRSRRRRPTRARISTQERHRRAATAGYGPSPWRCTSTKVFVIVGTEAEGGVSDSIRPSRRPARRRSTCAKGIEPRFPAIPAPPARMSRVGQASAGRQHRLETNNG